MMQRSLFGKTTIERFEDFHRENPHIYRLLVRYARKAKDRGYSHYGIKAIWELVRWNHMSRNGDESFKFNNNFTSHYAREIMHREADLKGFFEVRERK